MFVLFSSMESVSKARSRLLKFPQLLVECKIEATVYATCVTSSQNDLKKGCCQQEFTKFQQCLAKAAAKLGTRI